MKKILFSVLIALLLGTATAGARNFENSSVVGQVPDRVVITLKAGTTVSLDKSDGTARVGVASLDGLATRFSVHNMERLHAAGTTAQLREKIQDKASVDILDRIWAVDFPAEMGLDKVKAAYESLPEVEEVRLVDICKQYDAYLPDDPGISSQQYYLRNSSPGGGDVRALGGWNETLGDTTIIVCVLDSGVDWHHPDLGGDHPDKVNGAIWTNWDEYYGTPGVDDDSNGKTDDIRGWDFVHVPGDGGPDQDVETPDNDPMDFESHGTNCAGIVAAITNNGIGIAGTAPGCKIMAVRCGWYSTSTGGGVVRMDFAASGMVYAAANGAKIINCSWGSSSFLSSAVTTARNAGCLIITAAGNDNTDSSTELGVPSYLSTRDYVLSVAATDGSDTKATFSNFGTWVELAAPGVSMYTTAYVASTDVHTYASVQGTSFSSPLACGAAALIWSSRPDWLENVVSFYLTDSCDNIDAQNPGFEGLLGAGRINLQRALGDNIQQYPAEYPTLQDAFNCASVGDTIKVPATTLLNNPVTVIDRGLKFFGGYDASYETRDVENSPTVINGNLGGSALRFLGDTDTSTEVDGFLIQGGGGVIFSGIPYFARYGGGILLNGQSPTLRNLEVTGNSVGSTSDLGCGGGIMVNRSNPVLDKVYIHGNTGVYGAGLFAFESSLTLTGCDISDNIIITDNISYPAIGGGVHALDSDLTMVDCVVSGHLELQDGGGMYLAGVNTVSSLDMTGGEISGNSAITSGCGLYQNGGNLTMKGVDFLSNLKSAEAFFSHGGGIFATAATVSLDSLNFSGNVAHTGGGVDLNACTEVSLTHSVLAGNTAEVWGGGVSIQGGTANSVIGNTVFGNEATFSAGGGIYLNGNALEVSNNIVAFNTGDAASDHGMVLTAVPTILSCNDTYGNTGADYSGIPDPTGTDGNISADPLFCDSGAANFNLTELSPCAPANSGSCGLIGALTSGCGVSSTPDEIAAVPAAFTVEQNYPNPFNPSTTIKFALPAPGRTRVAIFDVAGHHIKTLVDEDLPAQTHQVVWTGQDDGGRGVAAGIYFYMVTSGSNRSVGRMALVK